MRKWLTHSLLMSGCALWWSAGNVAAQESSGQDSTATETNVPQAVKDLVVHIVAFAGTSSEDGAGIVVGMDSTRIYIATAAHVVDPESFDRIQVEFEAARQLVPAVVDTMADFESGIDLAVISVSLEAASAAGFTQVLDRLGASKALAQGDHVSPVGCPTGECWRAPVEPDRVVTSTSLELMFESQFVDGGSSGGGVFNRWWEVVGLVTNDVPPRAIALPIDFTIEQIRRWGVPVTLKRPRIPRGGYGLTVGFNFLIPTKYGAFPDGRAPSGRFVVTKSLKNGVDVNVGGLRLAPKGLGNACPPIVTTGTVTEVIALRNRAPCEAVVNALTGGLGYNVKFGRFVARPFAEIGIGKARGRFDLGGVYVYETDRYLPNLSSVEQVSFGGGGGLAMDFIAFPGVIVQALGGYWRFNEPLNAETVLPEYKPDMPEVFLGFGLRVGF